jgi:hypothetical protein
LTIGKGLGDMDGIGGDQSQTGEKSGERPVEVGGKELYEEIQMEEGLSIDRLQDAFSRLLAEGGVTGEGEEREVMLISLEEDGDEAVILQADLIGAGADGEAGEKGIDRETIVKLVKDYLRKKDKPKRAEDEEVEKGQKRDEL